MRHPKFITWYKMELINTKRCKDKYDEPKTTLPSVPKDLFAVCLRSLTTPIDCCVPFLHHSLSNW